MRVCDRSRVEVDWRCPRARFYLTEFGDQGIVRVSPQTELLVGTDLHEALAGLGKGEDAEVLASKLGNDVYLHTEVVEGKQGATDLSCISEGLFRGFAISVWPKWMLEYEVVAVEQEVTLELTPDLTFMARPDLILKQRQTGTFWYMEYKSTGKKDSRWINGWNKAVQLHAGCLATEKTLGFPITGCFVQGLYKGYRDRKAETRYVSPFSVGYRTANIPGVLETTYSYTPMRAKGWEKFCPRDHVHGLSGWVEGMPSDLLAEQFPVTPPILPRSDLIEAFLSQVLIRENELRAASDALTKAGNDENPHADDDVKFLLNKYFPQRFNQCEPAVGWPCSYRECCWLAQVGDDPIGSGFFKPRDPHHALELELIEGE